MYEYLVVFSFALRILRSIARTSTDYFRGFIFIGWMISYLLEGRYKTYYLPKHYFLSHRITFTSP